MSIAAIVDALVEAGATPQMIAAAVRAAEAGDREFEAERVLYCDEPGTYTWPQKKGKIDWNAVRKIVFHTKGSDCTYCGIGLHYAKDQVSGHTRLFTIDHAIPRARGGDHSPRNLVPSCLPCNASKGAKTPKEFAVWLRGQRPFSEQGAEQ